MFLSLDVLSANTFTNTFLIPRRTYDGVSLYGKATFDNVHLQNIVIPDEEILNISVEDTYGLNTIFLANFEDNLEMGNIAGVTSPIVQWRIKRRALDAFTPKLVANIDASESTFTDYLQANQKDYEYLIIPVAQDGTEGVSIATIAKSDFYSWFVCSEDNEQVYKFDLNVESEAIALNLDQKLFETFSVYPVMRTGKRKYRTGGLTTIPFAMNGNEFVVNNQVLKDTESFLSDGEVKILKNPSGDLFRVKISDISYKYMDGIIGSPFTISFKWTQVGDGE